MGALVMRNKSTQKIPPALKHGAYAATSVLPGESQADFDNLHQGLVDEFRPSGAFEDQIVETMAHLVWRRQNLRTLGLAEAAIGRYNGTDDPCRYEENQAAITRCIKQLLMVRGIKSLSADTQISPPKKIPPPSQAA